MLAFSPQTTMNKIIAPMKRGFLFGEAIELGECRFWMPAAVPYIRRAVVLYDPFVPEDRAHAARLAGPNVQFVKAPFTIINNIYFEFPFNQQ